MRVLCVEPGFDFSVKDVHNGWVKAFTELGHQVATVNLADRLTVHANTFIDTEQGLRKLNATFSDAVRTAATGVENVCYNWWPDLVFITSAFFIPRRTLALMRDRGHKVVILATESPYEDDRQAPLAGFCDLMLVNDPTNIDTFREHGRVEYQPHCYDPEVHHPRRPDPDLASDFAFVGTGFPSRVEFFEQVDWDGLDVLFAGTWGDTADDSPLRKFVAHDIHDSIDNADAARAYASTKVSCNLYRKEAERPELSAGWALGPREVELAACGTFFLREPRGEGDALFPFLPQFETPEGFGRLLRTYLNEPERRAEAAYLARKAIFERTFVNAAKRLLELIEP